MIDTKALRSRILDLAIQGKLTEQLESDGTAEELYQQIQEEKNNILSERKGRKDNNIKALDEEVPFEIPHNWKWIRFGETGFFRKGPFGSSLTKSMFVPQSENTIKVYEQQHAIKKNNTLGTYYITREYFDSTMSGFEVISGDIIISCAGTIGETYIMPDNIEKGIINQALMRITVVQSIDKQFFLYYFNANLKQNAKEESNGSTITNIPPFEVLKNWYFPLPPIAEQKRIVQRIEEIFRILDTIDEAQEKYIADVEILKAKLFTVAIQGKLTEQLEGDGTAEDLYNKIQAEKEILIKKGEMYNEKAIKKIKSGDIPYDIPKNWMWVRLGSLTKVVTKGSSPKWQGVNYTDSSDGILFITSENVGMGKMLLDKRKYVEKQFNEIHPASILKKGDILTNIVGASIGRTAVFDENIYTANINQAVCIIRLINYEMTDYILRYLCSKDAIKLMFGKVIDTARANLSLTSVANLMIPLPPLTEQKRIAEKLDEILKAIG